MMKEAVRVEICKKNEYIFYLYGFEILTTSCN